MVSLIYNSLFPSWRTVPKGCGNSQADKSNWSNLSPPPLHYFPRRWNVSCWSHLLGSTGSADPPPPPWATGLPFCAAPHFFTPGLHFHLNCPPSGPLVQREGSPPLLQPPPAWAFSSGEGPGGASENWAVHPPPGSLREQSSGWAAPGGLPLPPVSSGIPIPELCRQYFHAVFL